MMELNSNGTSNECCADDYKCILWMIKNNEYNQAFDRAVNVFENGSKPLAERIKSGIIALRFGYYQDRLIANKTMTKELIEGLYKILEELSKFLVNLCVPSK